MIEPHANSTKTSNWYALYTKFRHEFKVSQDLETSTIKTYLPVRNQVRQWCDRQKNIKVPLFYCYTFVNCFMDKVNYYNILNTKGVVDVVGSSWPNLSKIPNQQIESIKRALESRLAVTVLNELKKGDKVRIKSGPLKGIDGILIKKNPKKSFIVISLEYMNRSLEVEIDSDDTLVEKVPEDKSYYLSY